MKKETGSRTARVFTSIFNVRSWLDWERLKTFTLYLLDSLKKVFTPAQAQDTESFSSAVKEFNLTEQELTARQNALFYWSILMLCLALGIFGYAIYHLFYGTLKATLVSFVVSLLALVLAFRYHFWYFQFKERKLGCTIKEWFHKGILGEKS